MVALTPQSRALVIGASGAIGGAVVAALRARGVTVIAAARSATGEARRFDYDDEATLAALAGDGPYDLVFVATGELHEPEKSWRQQSAAAYARAFAVNTIGPALAGKHFLPALAKGGVFAVLSARVGSISDNRLGGWHAYRASKAALNMIVRNFAIELARRDKDAVAVALHPGTVASALTAPFRAAADVTTPGTAAAHLLAVIAELTPAQSGLLLDWRGAVVEP